MFSVNLVVADYYMHQPIPGLDLEYSEFRGYAIKEVPILRIFGSTKKGHKTCLHVHGVFPYIYIPYDGTETCGKEMYKIATSLDKLINASLGHANSVSQHVYNIHLVSGIPFYGYHTKESQYLKIYFYNPNIIRKAVELLQNGAVLNKIFQPHEAHIPFILQFMIDYKLHGMSFVSVSQVKFRRESSLDVPVREEDWLQENVKKLSTCRIEGDIQGCHIIAPSQSADQRSINPGLNAIWEEEKQRRRDENKPSQMTPQSSQNRPEQFPTESEVFYKEKLKEKLAQFFSQTDSEKEESGKTLEEKTYVYPAETPDGLNLLNASFIVNHTDPSLLPANTGVLMHGSQGRPSPNSTNIFKDAMLVNMPSSGSAESSTSTSDILLSSQDIDLAVLLGDLAAERKVDDDSILGSQKIDEESDGEEEDDDVLSRSMMEKVEFGTDEDTGIKASKSSVQDSKPELENEGILLDYSAVTKQEKDKIIDNNKTDFIFDNSDSGVDRLKITECVEAKMDVDSISSDVIPEFTKASETSNNVVCTAKDNDKSLVKKNGLETQMKLRPRAARSSQKMQKMNETSFSHIDRIRKDQKESEKMNSSQTHCKHCNLGGSCSGRSRKKNSNSPCQGSIKIKPCYVKLEPLQNVIQALGRTKTLEAQLSGNVKTSDLNAVTSEKLCKSKKRKCSSKKWKVPSLDGNNDSDDSYGSVESDVSMQEYTATWNERDVKQMQKKKKRRRKIKALKAFPTTETIELQQKSLSIADKMFESQIKTKNEMSCTSSVVTSKETCVTADVKSSAVVTEERDDAPQLPKKTKGKQCEDQSSPGKSQKRGSYKALHILLQKSPKKEFHSINPQRTSQEVQTAVDHCESKNNISYTNKNKMAIDAPEDSSNATGNLLRLNCDSKQKEKLKDATTAGKSEDECEKQYYITTGNERSGAGVVSVAVSDQETSDNIIHAEEDDKMSVYSWKLSLTDDSDCSLSSEKLPELLDSNCSGIHSFYETTFLSDTEALDENYDLQVDKSVPYLNINPDREDETGLPSSGEAEQPLNAEPDVKLNRYKSGEASPDQDFSSQPTKREKTDVNLTIFKIATGSQMGTVTSRRRIRRKLYDKMENQPISDSAHTSVKSTGIEILPTIAENAECEEFASNIGICRKEMPQNPSECRRLSSDGSLISFSPLQLSAIVESPTQEKTLSLVNPENTMSPDEVTLTQLLQHSTARRKYWRQSSRNSERPNVRRQNSESPSLHRMLLETSIGTQEVSPKLSSETRSPGQIVGITPSSSCGFEMTYANLQDVRAVAQCDNLTLIAMEVHITTRGDLKPDPTTDPIEAVFYTVVYSDCDGSNEGSSQQQKQGIIAVNKFPVDSESEIFRSHLFKSTAVNCSACIVPNEKILLQELITLVKTWDPDILAGYEVEMLSWGYVFKRAFTLEMNLCPEISRVPTAVKESKLRDNDTDGDMVEFSAEIKIVGRIVLNIWRLFRHEVSVMSYSFENMMYHILHQRIPYHSFKDLTLWWNHRTHIYRWMTVEHYVTRVSGIVKMLDQLDLIGRTCELARLFGIQFYEVLSRGSQFRVESMMLRLAKPYNFVPVSPSVQQRAKMRAPECLPLIMEPMSRFYTDPVIVLDFQSLYPSMMIAYNYCFSTCLGRIEELGQTGPFRFGCTKLRVNPHLLKSLEKDINVSPSGIAFVKENIRKGILPRMLEEILETRLMVKKSMKDNATNRVLQRVLHSRQLGLKLIANVTYGYTSANFSGRMPCIEVGDSVVSKGRETLERAIKLVEAREEWNVKVVYGDTDSLFVLVPGRTRQEAFKIGSEIAKAVTMDNPKPVKLKLEKVYQPCILQTKKRYVGYMYESPDQEVPVYDAKGIETVRRDGCPIVAKVLKQSLCILFESHDTNMVKQYIERQFTKLLQGRFNLQDMIFAREYRGISGYRPGACVPALELVRSWLKTDKCAEPRVGERVPYVIVNGPPGLPLIRLVRSPYSVLNDPGEKINMVYYITRVIIPPLDRCFSLLETDIESWYSTMPRKCSVYLPTKMSDISKKSTISQYFSTVNCAVCDEDTQTGLCSKCQKQPQTSALVLADKIRVWERNSYAVNQICQSCCGHRGPVSCLSLDCPVLFRRYRAARDLGQVPYVHQLQEKFFSF
ncbi:DNA polymerase zeta catalytic subunit [Schistocerca serialis cubense]|uniref:DNA polymerase zeta catalytic subunit n=1 Tax=Schistocerca serialis cubense TaxID=2023355 RepID=UPI00214E67DB|nr:DNA polymerase zeta catalytic subunit [Schistocerca serialis cubense]